MGLQELTAAKADWLRADAEREEERKRLEAQEAQRRERNKAILSVSLSVLAAIGLFVVAPIAAIMLGIYGFVLARRYYYWLTRDD